MAFGEVVEIQKDGSVMVEFTDQRGNKTKFPGKMTVRPGGMMVFEPGLEPEAEPVVLTPERIAEKQPA